MKTLSVIVPAYNEEKIIRENAKKIADYLDKHFDHYEVLVVDDGSKDSTIEEAKKVHGGVKVVTYKKNRGKGYAVKKGVLHAKYDNILFMDADLATPIEEIENLMPHLEDHDIVIASRELPQSKIKNPQNFIRRILGFIGKKIIGLLVVPGIKDTQCGFKLFQKDAALKLFKKQKIERWGFDFEILFLAKKLGYKIKEIPIVWYAGQESKLKLTDYIRTFLELIKVRVNYILRKY